MTEAILIIGFSLVLFVYWFRYTILLLLRDEQVVEQAALGLSLLDASQALRRSPDEVPLDRLHAALERDFKVISYLQNHAADLEYRPIEGFLLKLDYRMLRVWYRLTRNASASQARGALHEMSAVLTYMAVKMGQRAGVQGA